MMRALIHLACDLLTSIQNYESATESPVPKTYLAHFAQMF